MKNLPEEESATAEPVPSEWIAETENTKRMRSYDRILFYRTVPTDSAAPAAGINKRFAEYPSSRYR